MRQRLEDLAFFLPDKAKEPLRRLVDKGFHVSCHSLALLVSTFAARVESSLSFFHLALPFLLTPLPAQVYVYEYVHACVCVCVFVCLHGGVRASVNVIARPSAYGVVFPCVVFPYWFS